MPEEDDEPKGVIAAIRKHGGVIVGVVGLIAWFAMLWFMFGDVL